MKKFVLLLCCWLALSQIQAAAQETSEVSDVSNFMKLLHNRIEAFPCNEIVVKSLFKQNPELQGKFTHAPNAFITWDLCIGISKKSPMVEKIETINTLLANLQEKGVIARLVKKYTE